MSRPGNLAFAGIANILTVAANAINMAPNFFDFIVVYLNCVNCLKPVMPLQLPTRYPSGLSPGWNSCQFIAYVSCECLVEEQTYTQDPCHK